MPSEISTTHIQPTVSTPIRQTSVEAANVLRLLQDLPQSIVDGQKLQAQIVAAKQAGQVFEVLLKMALPDGKQTTLPAQANQILAPGQQVTLTAISQSQFTLTPALDKLAPALTRLDLAQLPSGTIIQAKVINLEPLAQGNFRATLSLNNTALAGQSVIIETPKALALNSVLTARVEGSFQLQFIPSSNTTDRLNIQQELLSQFNRQGSLGQALQQLQTVGSSTNLSSEGQKIVQQLLSNLPNISDKLTTAQLTELVKNSGTQLEQRLLTDATATQQDLKASLLRLIGQILPSQTGSNPLLTSAQASISSQALPQLLREIGGISLSQMREQALRFPLAKGVLQKLDNPNDLGALLRIAAAAISRLQTHQLSSLGQTYTTPEGTQLTTWQMEIPMRDQDTVIPLQLKFQQEQSNSEEQDEEKKAPIWRLELSFELEPLGPLHVQVNLKNEEISSKLWAEFAQTAVYVNKELHILRDKLLAAGLNIKELECLQGTPPAAPKAAIEQRWIDDLA